MNTDPVVARRIPCGAGIPSFASLAHELLQPLPLLALQLEILCQPFHLRLGLRQFRILAFILTYPFLDLSLVGGTGLEPVTSAA